MQPIEIKNKIISYRENGLKIFATCSFQTHSLVLLHILSTIDKQLPVYFINTGFHFPETVAFKDSIAKLFEIEVRSISSVFPKSMQKDMNGNFLFTSDADYCCYLNKTHPADLLLSEYDVWINGVRADQSSTRKNFKTEEAAPQNTIRFHPMLEWNPKMIYNYLKEHNIPHHPLEAKGYFSIGCEPCTQKLDLNSRDGRWFGLKKTECGLNTDLISK